MSFLYFEGTKDYVLATPCLITTFKASGSVTAGRLVTWDTGHAGAADVFLPPAGTISGSLPVAGLATATVADGEACPVIVWGYVKNIPVIGSLTLTTTDCLVVSGAGYASRSGSYTTMPKTQYIAGKVISGSATWVKAAFINCMF